MNISELKSYASLGVKMVFQATYINDAWVLDVSMMKDNVLQKDRLNIARGGAKTYLSLDSLVNDIRQLKPKHCTFAVSF